MDCVSAHGPGGGLLSEVGELITHRRTLRLMARQDLKNTFRNYRLGLVWALAEPLGLALMMWLVFSFIFTGRADRIGLDPFIVYLITGILPFQWLAQSIGRGPKVFRKYGNMLTYSPLPVWFWPLRGVVSSGAEFLLSIPIIFALVLVFGAQISWGVLLLPVAILLQVVLCTGLSMLGAALSLKFPDVEKMTGILNRMPFWTSPIIWASKDFPDWLQSWLYLNPFQLLLDLYRAIVWPEEVGSFRDWMLSLTMIVVIFVAGSVLLKLRVRDVRRIEE